WDELLNAYLTLRDSHLDDLDATDGAILVALAEGETQRAIADRLGLHESSVSRRVHRHRLATLLDTSPPAVPGFGWWSKPSAPSPSLPPSPFPATGSSPVEGL